MVWKMLSIQNSFHTDILPKFISFHRQIYRIREWFWSFKTRSFFQLLLSTSVGGELCKVSVDDWDKTWTQKSNSNLDNFIYLLVSQSLFHTKLKNKANRKIASKVCCCLCMVTRKHFNFICIHSNSWQHSKQISSNLSFCKKLYCKETPIFSNIWTLINFKNHSKVLFVEKITRKTN